MTKTCALILLSLPAVAFGADALDVEALKRELRELRERTEQLERKLQAIETSGRTNAPAVAPHDHASHDHAAHNHEAHDHGTNVHDHSNDQRTSSHIHIGRESKHTLDISLNVFGVAGTSTERDVDELQLGGHDPHQRGFTLQQAELALDGHLEPHLRGQMNTIFFITPDGDTEFELEEAFLETLTLPGNLQLKAGHFLSEFGRHNATHLHTWDFVDTPLVNARLLGPDGLRNPGARLSWRMPTPIRSELFLAIQNSGGEAAHGFRGTGHSHGDEEEEEMPFAFRHPDNDRGVRTLGDLLFVPRYALSFEPTDHQSVIFGASAAFGPNNSGADAGSTDTQVYGVDFTWKWSATDDQHGYPFVAFQTEAMLRKYDAGAFDWDEDGDGAVSPGEVADPQTGLPAVLQGESLTDYGFYAQMLYGFHEGWVAGLRADWIGSDEANYETRGLLIDGESLGRDPSRAERWRISPNLTWHPTEFSKVRLQYNYDQRKHIPEKDDDHSVWLQFEFTLGAHPPH